jgi:surface antigen
MKTARLLSVGLLSVSLVAGLGACENAGTKETIGTLGGAAAGGLLGSQIGGGSGQLIATGAGVLLGAFLGREIGKSLDKADQLEADRTANQALENNPTGQSSTWNNPDSGNSGTVTPTQTTYSDSGEPCREYQTTVTVGGKTEQAYGTACRNADGTWRIVN